MSRKSALTHGVSAVAEAVQQQCGAAVSDAAGAETQARDKWLRAGKALAKAGVTSQMLVKATEKNPNDAFDAVVLDSVRTFIIQGVSVAKKTLTFASIVPGSVSEETPKGSNRWTVATLLALTREQLRDIDDDILKTQRRVYMQLIDGPMLSRIREYVDRANGIEKTRGEKKEKEETKTESTDPVVTLQAWAANAAKMVDVVDVQRFQDSAFEMIACLRRVRKA
jgi:hypothetical protein